MPLGIFQLSKKDEEALDAYEGYPELYMKQYINLKVKNKTVKALIYIMRDKFDYNNPSKNYVDTCINGYKDFGFDLNILKQALIDSAKEKKNKEKVL